MIWLMYLSNLIKSKIVAKIKVNLLYVGIILCVLLIIVQILYNDGMFVPYKCFNFNDIDEFLDKFQTSFASIILYKKYV